MLYHQSEIINIIIAAFYFYFSPKIDAIFVVKIE